MAIESSEQIAVTMTVDFGVCMEYLEETTLSILLYVALLTENIPQKIMTNPTTTGSMKI